MLWNERLPIQTRQNKEEAETGMTHIL